MPYLRCGTCGVLSYVPRNAGGEMCPECGVPLAPGEVRPGDSGDGGRRLDHLLRLTRSLLDTDLVLLTQIRDGCEVALRTDGEWPGSLSFQDACLPLEETFCQRMLEGRIGNYVADARTDARVSDLALAHRHGVRAWLGVPIRLSDAELYILCCLAAEARPSVGEREVRLLAGLAESVRAELEAAPARPSLP